MKSFCSANGKLMFDTTDNFLAYDSFRVTVQAPLGMTLHEVFSVNIDLSPEELMAGNFCH